MLIKRKIFVVAMAIILISVSYGIYTFDHDKKSSDAFKVVYPPEYKVLINQTFQITTPSYDNCGQIFTQNITKFFIQSDVNFSNYCLEASSNSTTYVYIKSLEEKNNISCCNCAVDSLSNYSRKGGVFVYDKDSKYIHSARGEWEIEVQTKYKSSLKVIAIATTKIFLLINT